MCDRNTQLSKQYRLGCLLIRRKSICFPPIEKQLLKGSHGKLARVWSHVGTAFTTHKSPIKLFPKIFQQLSQVWSCQSCEEP